MLSNSCVSGLLSTIERDRRVTVSPSVSVLGKRVGGGVLHRQHAAEVEGEPGFNHTSSQPLMVRRIGKNDVVGTHLEILDKMQRVRPVDTNRIASGQSL